MKSHLGLEVRIVKNEGARILLFLLLALFRPSPASAQDPGRIGSRILSMDSWTYEAIERLQAYDWPGNVRELENALMRAAIVARGTVIGSDHLALGQETQRADGDLSLASATRRHVKRVVGLLDGDETSAAKRLGISKKELKEHLASD